MPPPHSGPIRPHAAPHSAAGLVAWELIRTLIGVRHDEPRFESRADRLGARYLEAHGVAVARSRSTTTGRKANLFATLPARDGNATTGGIVLSGHTDVVPVDGQPWDTPSVRGHAASATACTAAASPT